MLKKDYIKGRKGIMFVKKYTQKKREKFKKKHDKRREKFVWKDMPKEKGKSCEIFPKK